MWKTAFDVKKAILIGRLQMDREGIVDAGLDSPGLEPFADCVSVRQTQHVLMKDVVDGSVHHSANDGYVRQKFVVTIGDSPTAGVFVG